LQLDTVGVIGLWELYLIIICFLSLRLELTIGNKKIHKINLWISNYFEYSAI
jgi:hypothetical protein